ncbi:hypothetical protein BDV19DRAFT_374274 [Aspergillus venezuelensis]
MLHITADSGYQFQLSILPVGVRFFVSVPIWRGLWRTYCSRARWSISLVGTRARE